MADCRFELRRVPHEDPRLLDECGELVLLIAQLVPTRAHLRIRRFTGVELGLDRVDLPGGAESTLGPNRGSPDLAVQLAETRVEGSEERLLLLDPDDLRAERISTVSERIEPALQS